MLTENGLTFKKVILAVGKSDLRRGIDGLAAMVRLKYGLDPLQEDTLFLFCGVRRDRLKGLLWAGGQVHSSVYPAGGRVFPMAGDSGRSQKHYPGGI